MVHLKKIQRTTGGNIYQSIVQENHYDQHFHLNELLTTEPRVAAPYPSFLLIASVLCVCLVPFIQSWIALGIESQILLYAGFRSFSSPSRYRAIMAGLIAAWGMLLLVFPPVSL